MARLGVHPNVLASVAKGNARRAADPGWPARRLEQIVAADAAGLTAREIAAAHGLSVARARQLIAKGRRPPVPA